MAQGETFFGTLVGSDSKVRSINLDPHWKVPGPYLPESKKYLLGMNNVIRFLIVEEPGSVLGFGF